MRGELLFLALLAAHPALAQTVEVRIRDYKFVPEHVRVKPGATVRWVNDERRTSHSMLFEGEKIESQRLMPGESRQRTFDRPGSYPYVCGPHPEMRGVIEVIE